MEKLYLVPGNSISKKGLPGGKIECKKGSDPLALKDSHFKVIEKNVSFWKTTGKLIDQAGFDKLMAVEDKSDSSKSDSSKSDARIALEKEASEFGIEFTDKTTAKDLKAEIEAKKSETIAVSQEFKELIDQAKELDIKFEGLSFEDLKLLIEDKLE